MPTTPQQIDLWRTDAGEHQRLEFKEAKERFDPDKLNRYCVALANEGGGHVVLGIADAPPRPVVGTCAFPNLVRTAERIFTAVGFRVDVDEVLHCRGSLCTVARRSSRQGSTRWATAVTQWASRASFVS